MSRNAFRAICLAALAAAVVLLAPPARAGTTGKLVGRITDEKKQPLAGVNIRLEGLRLGTATDESGNYFIIGIPAGTYTVRANLLGQAPFAAENVQIAPDFTTTLNVLMRTEAVQMAEVRVEAERPLLQKDATGTTRFISSGDIAKLPTRGYRDAASQQTGVVTFRQQLNNHVGAQGSEEAQNSPTLIVRGGRPNETAYYVDGFSQQDPLSGTSNTAISNNAIEEVVVLTGGFNPEYGRVMSGAVNVITREGTKKYFGALESVTDVLSGTWDGAPKTDYNVYDASIGGPVLPGSDNLTFYLSGERRWQGDRGPVFMTDLFKSDLKSVGLSSDRLPSNQSSGNTFQGKLNWQPTDKLTFKAGGLGSQEDWRQYLNTYLFNLAHAPRYLDRSESYFVTANHVLSKRTFYNLAVNYNLTQRKRGDGLAFDNLSPQYQTVGTDGATGHPIIASEDGSLVTPGGYFRTTNPRFDLLVPQFWNDGHVWDDYLQRRSEYLGFQGAVTSQVNPWHQLKAGGDYQRHTLRLYEHYFPVQIGGDTPNLVDYDGYGYTQDVTYKDVIIRDITQLATGPDTTFRTSRVVDRVSLNPSDSGRDGAKHPKVWSLYAQDKFEREGVVINGGLRYDHLNVDTPALRSDLRPLDPDFTGSSTLSANDLVKNKTYARLSPRLGVAFPISAQTVLRFNYGQFYQQPNLQDLYVSYRFLEHKVQTGGYFVGFGNPNLRPERTTAYEVGVAHQLGTNVRLDVTAYYKDVKDLVEIATIPSFPNQFSSFRNRDFATIKGVDLGFKMRPMNHVSADINYSLSFAQGTGSVSNTQSNIAWTADHPPKMTSPLDFDQRHKLSFNLDYSLDKDQGPEIMGYRLFQNFGVNLLYNVSSGTPYTPTKIFDAVTLAAVQTNPTGPINSQYGPWTSNLDLKASKGFDALGLKMDAYVWVLNLLDTRNPIQVYGSTGSALSTGWLETEDGQAYLAGAGANGRDGQRLYDLAQNNPTYYSNPRLVRFGLRTNF
jgi:outer membrane receptor protein involved in Fe transport